MDKIRENFSCKLREARELRKITQVTMAKTLGFARQTYLDIETGKTEPRFTTVAKLANILKLPLSYFYDDPYCLTTAPLDDLLAEVKRRSELEEGKNKHLTKQLEQLKQTELTEQPTQSE